jgi:hypothetical protein
LVIEPWLPLLHQLEGVNRKIDFYLGNLRQKFVILRQNIAVIMMRGERYVKV